MSGLEGTALHRIAGAGSPWVDMSASCLWTHLSEVVEFLTLESGLNDMPVVRS